MLPKTKRQQVIELVSKCDFNKAFRIAKNFTIELTKDQQRTVQIAHESLSGKNSFYTQLGINTDNEIKKAKDILISIYA